LPPKVELYLIEEKHPLSLERGIGAK